MASESPLTDFAELEEKIYEATRFRSAHHRPGLDWLHPVEEVNQVTTPSHDALLVGPADRYEVGHMLRPHVLTRLVNFSKFRCAGLVARDLTRLGGHAVRNYGESALEMPGSRVNLVHFGGETLGLDLSTGYADALAEEERDRFESLRHISEPGALQDYVRRRTAQLDDFGYVLAAEGEFHEAPSSFHAVSLSDPDALTPSRRERLLSLLRRARFVGIRDEIGAGYLESEGIEVHRMPCSLTVLPQVCARQLRESRDQPALEQIRTRFPNGWIAVDVAGIDAVHAPRLEAALGEVAEKERLGLVFFDSANEEESGSGRPLRRWVESFPEWVAAAFGSKRIWDVASLLLHSRLYCGGSLDSRILCMSGGVARIQVPSEKAASRSYCELWEHDDVPIEFAPDEKWSDALEEALAVDLSVLQQHATWLHGRYFESHACFCEATGMHPRLTSRAKTPHEKVQAELHHLHDSWLDEEAEFENLQALRRRQRRRGVRRMVGDRFARLRRAESC